ncbi:MAG: hypothetical protein JST81_13015 [Bacteroidetes bacterium]|nr:hypothetical protein [Bacteroidota bacterium]
MRVVIAILVVMLFFTSCKKDKYTSAPQIKYKSLTTNFFDNSVGAVSPAVVFSITDAEGDLGDTAYIHLKNLLTGQIDSLPFPDISGASIKKNLKADITASVGRLGGCFTSNPPGRVDTMYYEIYVTDFAKNKSNTIVTGDPVFQQCQ